MKWLGTLFACLMLSVAAIGQSVVVGLFSPNGGNITGPTSIITPGAASTPALFIQGTPYAGTASNSYGQLALSWNTGTMPSNLSTAGTGFAEYALSGWNGAFIAMYNGTTREFQIDSFGTITTNAAVSVAGNVTTSGGYMQAKYLSTGIGTAVASAATIALGSGVTHITGTAAISTITPPSAMSSSQGGCLTVIADGAWSTGTSGNIATTLTASATTPYTACYDGSKWYLK